jgi:hypothetical protein
MEWRGFVGAQNLVVDLGKWDFEKDPALNEISIDDSRVCTVMCTAKEGHVYLERVNDSLGNDFSVLFKVVALDPQSRYMAFVWRKLPVGAKAVKD